MIHLEKLQSISLLFVRNLMSKNKIPGNIYDFEIKTCFGDINWTWNFFTCKLKVSYVAKLLPA